MIAFLSERRHYLPLLCLIAALLNLRAFLREGGEADPHFFLTVCFVLAAYGLLFAALFWVLFLLSPRLPLAAALIYAIAVFGRGPEGLGGWLDAQPFRWMMGGGVLAIVIGVVFTSQFLDALTKTRLPRHFLWPLALLCGLYAFWGLACLRQAHWLVGLVAHLVVLGVFGFLLFLGDRLHVPAIFNGIGFAVAVVLAVLGMGRHIHLEPPPTEGKGQNFLVITVEGLRYDAITPESMPAAAALARRGFLFTRMYGVSPAAMPNLEALFLRGEGSGSAALARLFPDRFTRVALLPERLIQWPERKGVGFERVQKQGERYFLDRLFRAWAPAALFLSPDRSIQEAQVMTQCRDLLEQTSRPFVVWMHLDFPSRALPDELVKAVRAGASVSTAEMRAYYGQALRRLDEGIGNLAQWLFMQPWAEKTNLLLVGVSGMELGDHASAGSGHAYYEESVRLPFLWIGPPVTPGQASTPISIMDLFPTLVKAFHLSDKPKAFAGMDIASAFQGVFPADRVFPMTANEAYGPARAVVAGGFKLIQAPDGAFRLFDLTADPLERHDQACVMAARMEQMKGLLP